MHCHFVISIVPLDAGKNRTRCRFHAHTGPLGSPMLKIMQAFLEAKQDGFRMQTKLLKVLIIAFDVPPMCLTWLNATSNHPSATKISLPCKTRLPTTLQYADVGHGRCCEESNFRHYEEKLIKICKPFY